MSLLVGPNTYVEGIPLGVGVRYRPDESGYFELDGEWQGVIGHPSHYSQRGVTGLMGVNAKGVVEDPFIDNLDIGLGLSFRSSGEKLVASMVSFELSMDIRGLNSAGFQLGLG